uniref:Secreted protein n=1 Tax=Pararge aegeria TaxID=116150 RepID=S4PSZ3_9NEOP
MHIYLSFLNWTLWAILECLSLIHTLEAHLSVYQFPFSLCVGLPTGRNVKFYTIDSMSGDSWLDASLTTKNLD